MAPQSGGRTLRALIAAEFALATLRLICGGLLFRAYDRVRHVDPGFNADGVLTFSISLPEATYKDPAARLAFWERVETRLAGVSGVERAGLVTCPPFGCHWGRFFRPEGAPPPRPDEPNPVVLYRYVTPRYAGAMGLRLKAGRWIEPADGAEGPQQNGVAVVNETFARTFFPAVTDVVGKRFHTNANAPGRMTRM